MRKIIFSAALLGLFFSFSNCKEKPIDKVLTKEIVFQKEGTLEIMKAENDSVVASLEIEIANDEYERQTGLMHRESMVNNQGMLFIFKDNRPRTFYMKNTEFALDIIYLNPQKEIINIQKDAKPFDESSLPSDGPAMYVLEINAGLSDTWGLEPGDKVEWRRELEN